MAGHHDIGYKHLFAHPELVRERIAEFTPFSWFQSVDVSAFERVNPSYTSARFSERHDDLVWRVKCGDQWLYIYILLEFQSHVERWMALRMQVYIGLLYQDLIKRHDVSPEFLLPPVLLLGFYNGSQPWSAELNLGNMIMAAPAGLAEFQAAQRYCLIDQKRLDPNALARHSAILATLFRLELSKSPRVVRKILTVLVHGSRAGKILLCSGQLLCGPNVSLRANFPMSHSLRLTDQERKLQWKRKFMRPGLICFRTMGASLDWRKASEGC